MASPQARLTPSRLYVSNLSQGSTLAGMRALFGSCGDVLDIEFAAERSVRQLPSAAYVTMATSAAADKAVHALHGRLHGDRVLVISRVEGDAASSSVTAGAARATAAAAKQVGVAVTQQYRDRHGLTYELSSPAERISLRFLFPVDDSLGWQLELRFGSASQPAVAVSGLTRPLAFLALSEACAPGTASALDWEKIADALRTVKAL